MSAKAFDEYVLDWWQGYVPDTSEENRRYMMEQLIGEEECIDDYIPEDAASVEEWLSDYDTVDAIYSTFLYECSEKPDDAPDLESFLADMYKQAYTCSYSYAQDFIEDMAYHSSGYSDPTGFFEDLQAGGCSSGMIGMLIYNSDCKDIYIKNIDDMEEFVEEFSEELGETIHLSTPRYTSVCWLVTRNLHIGSDEHYSLMYFKVTRT